MAETCRPYRAWSLSGGLAALTAAVSRRFGAFEVVRNDRRGDLTFLSVPEPPSWRPVGGVGLEAGGFNWRLALGSWKILGFYDALGAVNPDDLPLDFKLAASALVFQSELAALERALETPVTLTGSAAWEEESGADGLEFGLAFNDGQGLPVYVPLRVQAADAGAYAWLAARLEKWPVKKSLRVDGLRISAAVLAGEMRVPLNVARSLSVGDILLPPSYPALQNHLILKIKGRPGIHLNWNDGSAQVLPPAPQDKEMPVPDTLNNTNLEEDRENRPVPLIGDIDALEVDLAFELGTLNISLKELAALTPGAAFPLNVEPTAPVTLTVNGQPMAQGRLVDLDGVLGVQVVKIADGV